MTHLRTTRSAHHGMTLIELLVVVGILSIMMGIAAVAVRTGTKGKKQREAARQVNAFVAGVQARAFELGRPCGFEIVRHGTTLTTPNSDANNISFRMYMLESPPVYAGDLDTSTLRLNQLHSASSTVPAGHEDPLGPPHRKRLVLVDALGNSPSASFFLANNEVGEIRLEYRGPKYDFRVIQASPQLQIAVFIPPSDNRFDRFAGVDLATVNVSMPFQLYLRPTRSSVTPLQLPSDMCIDLAFSGMGASDRQFHNSNPMFGAEASVNVMFSPTGSVDRIYDINGIARRPIGNVHLLVGKFDQAVNLVEVEASMDAADLPAPLNSLIDNSTNLYDATSMWVSVNYLSGQVSTTRNAFIDPGAVGTLSDRDVMSEARKFAQRTETIQGQGDE
ncbi:MAG: prepilin-type N-terminal cleavage/methylation domain-containing protein, partial [Pirellulaceae bacterium]